ncbi:MAG: hypothetical protein U9P44_03555, partial [archaeon]|nr:hypothetical protein [archaeon]
NTIISELTEVQKNASIGKAPVTSIEMTGQILPLYETATIYRYIYTSDVSKINYSQRAKIGIDSGINKLAFGNLLTGTTSTKTIMLENTNKTDFLVNIIIQGNGTEHIEIDKEFMSFSLKKEASKDIPIRFNASKPGHFYGEINLIIMKLTDLGSTLHPLLK